VTGEHCGITPDYSEISIVEIEPEPRLNSYQRAMVYANNIAEEMLGRYMLLTWYDRDRDFESPQHASECHENSAIPGYVDYALNHGATLKIDFYQGRYVFFFLDL